jgi:hypothetical protein
MCRFNTFKTTMQENTSESTPHETRPPKRSITHTRGLCKKEKVHKQLPEYTIIEDDTKLMPKRVQDHAIDDFEEAQHHRIKIQDDLAGMN